LLCFAMLRLQIVDMTLEPSVMTRADVIRILESRGVSMRAYLAFSGKHADYVCRLIAYNDLGLLVKENRHLHT